MRTKPPRSSATRYPCHQSERPAGRAASAARVQRLPSQHDDAAVMVSNVSRRVLLGPAVVGEVRIRRRERTFVLPPELIGRDVAGRVSRCDRRPCPAASYSPAGRR